MQLSYKSQVNNRPVPLTLSDYIVVVVVFFFGGGGLLVYFLLLLLFFLLFLFLFLLGYDISQRLEFNL